MPNVPELEIVHNEPRHRFETGAGSLTSFVSYSVDGPVVVFDHTYVPNELRGKGIAAALVRTALTEARARHWKIIPGCSYVAAYLERHPEFADLGGEQP